jgi:adenylate kinase family enzyme
MEKIVIIGSPGAGKSTLARNLHSILNVNVIHLDRVFWESGWKEKPRETRIDILHQIVQEKQWIIEGTYLDASEPRLNASDTIIFLDIPLYVCLVRVIRQHFKCRGEIRSDLKEGCKDELNLIRVLKVLGFPFRGRRTLKQKLRIYRYKQIFELHSSSEVDDFLAQLLQGVDYKRESPVLCTSTFTNYSAFPKLAKMHSK